MEKNPSYYRQLLTQDTPYFLLQLASGHCDWMMFHHHLEVRAARKASYQLAQEGYTRNRKAFVKNRQLMSKIIQEFNRVASLLETHTLLPKRGYSPVASFRATTRTGFRDAAEESTKMNEKVDSLLEAVPNDRAPLAQLVEVIDQIADHMHMTNEAQSILRSFHNQYTIVPISRRNRTTCE